MRELAGDLAFSSQAEFEAHWRGFLFPELVSPKKRPPSWSGEDPEWVTGEDVRWNSGYTRSVFPEALWGVRNSGTLLRDWEEAAAWIYLEFEWDRIIASLTKETRLIKVR
jgi:hypothetical protein